MDTPKRKSIDTPARLRPAALMIAILGLLLPELAQGQAFSSGYMQASQYLTTNQYMVSPQKMFFVILQGDGNLCVYKGSGPSANKGSVWCTGTGGAAGDYFATIQGDGNFCIYKGANPSANKGGVWCNGTGGGSGNFFLQVQDDSKLVLFSGLNPSSGPTARWTAPGSLSQNDLTTYLFSARSPNPVGDPKSFYNLSNYAREGNYPGGQQCNSATYTVPANIYVVKITATGGTGQGGDASNAFATMAAMAGLAGFNIPAPGIGTMKGGSGGRGAVVSAFFNVTPGQVLYITPGTNGVFGVYKYAASLWNSLAFPGSGSGYQPGGGLSLVTTAPAARVDYRACSAPKDQILLVAGGGGGGGSSGTSGAGGNGGDAGSLGGNGFAASGGNGGMAGGGGGGGSQTAGGYVGTHPGCGTEDRQAGSLLHGGYTFGYGGAGGAGYFGGGAGGDGDCVLNTGHGGGGGGSSYADPGGMMPTSNVDTNARPGVTIQAFQF